MKYEVGGACNTRGVGDKHAQTFCRETRTDVGDLWTYGDYVARGGKETYMAV